MASLPGMPGNMGLPGGVGIQPSGTPSGSDLSLDLPTPGDTSVSSAWPSIVNKTVLHWGSPFGPDDGHGGELPTPLTIPPTTEGNTLVIVQNSLWDPDYPRFNGKTAGWDDSGNFTPNDVLVGIFGGTGLPTPLDTPPGLGSPQNAGSLIAYFTNIAGGISTISYGDVRGQHGAPEWTVVYELTPSLVVDGNPIYEFIDENNFGNSSPFLNVPVNGPADPVGTYFSGMMTADSATASAFTSISSPWAIDEQDTFVGGSHGETGIAAVGIILGGSGLQQAAWSGGSANEAFVSAAISLVNSTPFTPPPTTGDVNQFLPNVWIVS